MSPIQDKFEELRRVAESGALAAEARDELNHIVAVTLPGRLEWGVQRDGDSSSVQPQAKATPSFLWRALHEMFPRVLERAQQMAYHDVESCKEVVRIRGQEIGRFAKPPEDSADTGDINPDAEASP